MCGKVHTQLLVLEISGSFERLKEEEDVEEQVSLIWRRRKTSIPLAVVKPQTHAVEERSPSVVAAGVLDELAT